MSLFNFFGKHFRRSGSTTYFIYEVEVSRFCESRGGVAARTEIPKTRVGLEKHTQRFTGGRRARGERTIPAGKRSARRELSTDRFAEVRKRMAGLSSTGVEPGSLRDIASGSSRIVPAITRLRSGENVRYSPIDSGRRQSRASDSTLHRETTSRGEATS